MQILWQGGDLKPAEILEQHPRSITNSTLRSFLKDLLRKGHVSRVRRGKVYYYRALTKAKSAFRERLSELVDAFCEGSTLALAKHLFESEALSPEELAELKQLVQEIDGQESKEDRQ
jgi:predicted transcriptional regulator